MGEAAEALYPVEIPDPSATFAPYAFIPELGMLVQVFPYDRRLPALPLLMSGASPDLEPPLLTRFGPGDWHVQAWDAEPVRYRAELGATLRLTVQARDKVTGRAEERLFYAKVYQDEEEGEQTYQTLRAVRDEAGGARFVVGRPVAYLGGLRTLLQEETPGISLQDLLLREDKAIPAALRGSAGALAALHLDHSVPTPRRHRLRDEVAALERTGELLRWVRPRLGEEIHAIVGAVVAGLEEVPPAPVHRDLKLDHILLDGDRLALLDLDWFAGADPVLDAADVLAHLAGMPLRSPLPDDHARAAAQTFAGEYFTHVPKSWRARLPLHYAGALLKVAVGFFRRQEPGWSDKITTLLEEARDSLAGRVW